MHLFTYNSLPCVNIQKVRNSCWPQPSLHHVSSRSRPRTKVTHRCLEFWTVPEEAFEIHSTCHPDISSFSNRPIWKGSAGKPLYIQ